MKEMGGSKGISDEVIRGHDGEVEVVRHVAKNPRTARNDGVKA